MLKATSPNTQPGVAYWEKCYFGHLIFENKDCNTAMILLSTLISGLVNPSLIRINLQQTTPPVLFLVDALQI